MAEQKERRSDIGSKIMIGLILGGFGTIIGFFINTLVGSAQAGMTQANIAINQVQKVELRVQAIESQNLEYMKRIDERFEYIRTYIQHERAKS